MLVRWNPDFGIRSWRRFGPRYHWRMAPYWDTRVAMPLDIEENEDNYVIKASVPGFAPEDLKIEVKDGILTIRAEHDSEDEQESNGWHLRERNVGTIERRLRLSDDVNTENVDAELEHGVLTLTLSKVEAVKPKQIEIKAA
jgi:HSP20 family protein